MNFRTFAACFSTMKKLSPLVQQLLRAINVNVVFLAAHGAVGS